MTTMPPEVAERVAAAYLLGKPSGQLAYAARGELGRIWRLDTDRGSWAIKELLVPGDEDGAQRDVAFQFAAAAAGVPLPLPLLARDGRVILPGPEAGVEYGVRGYEWAALESRNPVVRPADIGQVTALLHRIRRKNGESPEEWFSQSIAAGAWQTLLADARQAGAPWAEVLEERLADLIELDIVVVPPDPDRIVTCHRDVNLENVLRAADGGVVVLDWENSGPAQPERELAAILADLCADISLDAAAQAYNAYRTAGGSARVTRAEDFAMAAAVQAHLLQLYSRRALSPAEPVENRERAQRRLAAMLGSPLTTSRIQQMLHRLRS